MTTAVVLALATAACGSDSNGSRSNQSTMPTETAPTATVAPTTTVAEETTVAAQTTSNPTRPDRVATGWTSIDPSELPAIATPPCCDDTWHGQTSPALPPPDAPLADGEYFTDTVWPLDLALPLMIDVFRFDQCGVLLEGACPLPPSGFDHPATALGVDRSTSRPMTVTLDDTVRAIVVGVDDATGSRGTAVHLGTGSDLAELATAVDAAYASVFSDRFLAGEERDTIIADALDNPREGFSPASESVDGFVYSRGDGPRLLFQAALSADSVTDEPTGGRGVDALTIHALDSIDGTITLFVFAAFTP